jgi:hypothetical protein
LKRSKTINNGNNIAAAFAGEIEIAINGTPRTASPEPKPLFEIPIIRTARAARI